MERFLVALDCAPGPMRSVHYVARVLKGAEHAELILFHVIAPASPNLLKREEVRRLELLHELEPRLQGYFWKEEDEQRMQRGFEEARSVLLEAGFSEKRVKTHYNVESDDVAQVIVGDARALGCSTIIVGRRRLSRVKELLLGSVSSTVVKLGRGMTVWVVDY